jgi:lysyl-tRNA synthetase class 2
MKIVVSDEVFKMFPGYVRHVLIARNADNAGENAELLALLREEESRIRKDYSFGDFKNHPRIVSWRAAFEKFGMNPNQCPPSIANLIKRVRGGKELPYINSLVAIFNIMSMRHVIPAGGDDLDKVTGDIALKQADGSETYVPLGSREVAEHPKPGEIILCDTGDGDVFCRAWCWKNGDRSKIESNTKSVAINIDALPPVTAKEGFSAAENTASLVRRYCGADVTINILSVENVSIDLP